MTYNRLINNLDDLELAKFKENLDTYIELTNTHKKTFVEALYEITEIELKFKDERAINACVKAGNNLPFYFPLFYHLILTLTVTSEEVFCLDRNLLLIRKIIFV